MIHTFPDTEPFHLHVMHRSVEGFTNPFRYVPHPLVREAAGQVLSMLKKWRAQPDGSSLREIERSFAEGKMLGVLVVTPDTQDNTDVILNEVKNLHFLAAFSGTVRGADGLATATVEGFVPPIIDLTDPSGYFKKAEAEISDLNARISQISSSTSLSEARARLKEAQEQRDSEISQMQKQILLSKSRRDELRHQIADPQLSSQLIRESQFQKAELKRLKDRWKATIEGLSSVICNMAAEIDTLKKKRAQMSDALQKWIFDNAIVHNSLGESSSILNIFEGDGLTPPGGTGDCAAPKLLEYAYKNNLKPLAMGEFWYGHSPETAVRTHGHFYPSCTSKCGPLLGYMMKGLDVQSNTNLSDTAAPVIIYEDDAIIVVEKPSGMPSVPGLDGRKSLQEWLHIHAVHRLDMDTSGVMVFAKTQLAAVNLRRQFEEHTVRKIYMAKVSARFRSLPTQSESKGNRLASIDLPLSPDYDERPRQKVDFKQGKEAHTEYEIIKEYADGTADLLLYPHTGRTHQLRVHCAHTLGLGRPILGDLLYGAHTVRLQTDASAQPSRLCLHALSITFRHPDTDAPLTFTSQHLCY